MKFNHKTKKFITASLILGCALTSISISHAMHRTTTEPEERAVARVSDTDFTSKFPAMQRGSTLSALNAEALQWFSRYVGQELDALQTPHTLAAQRDALRSALQTKNKNRAYDAFYDEIQGLYSTLPPQQQTMVTQRFQKRVPQIEGELKNKSEASTVSTTSASTSGTTTTSASTTPQTSAAAPIRQELTAEEKAEAILKRKTKAIPFIRELNQEVIGIVTSMKDPNALWDALNARNFQIHQLSSAFKKHNGKDVLFATSPPSAQRTQALQALYKYTIEAVENDARLSPSEEGWRQAQLEILRALDVSKTVLEPEEYKALFVPITYALGGIFDSRGFYTNMGLFFEARNAQRQAFLSTMRLQNPDLWALTSFLSQHNWDVVLAEDQIYPSKISDLTTIGRLAANTLENTELVEKGTVNDESAALVAQLRNPELQEVAKESAGYQTVLQRIAEAYKAFSQESRTIFETMVTRFFEKRLN